MSEYHTGKLKNDLRIIMNKNSNQTTATVCVFINVGSTSETPQMNGVSHFIEHLFFKGTKLRPTQKEIAIEFEKYGANANAFTDRELTCYHVKVNADHLEEIIEILSDILTNSLYKTEDIEMEKNVIINEIHQRNSNQSYLINNTMYEQFFRGLPISKSVAGRPDIIKKIDRAMIMAFLYKFYRPDNMAISVSGNFKSYDSMKYLLEKHFGNKFHRNYRIDTTLFKRSIEQLDNYKKQWDNVMGLIPPTYMQNKILYHITPRTESEHTFVSMAFAGLKFNDSNKYKASFLAHILGEGMSSRLFNKIRSKYGLVYTIKASNNTSDNCGLFRIDYSCNHSFGVQIKILELIKDEIELLKREPITQEEYNNTISSVENHSKMSQENSYENSLHYGMQLLKADKIKTYKDIVNEYKNISISELQQFANQLFNWNKFLIVTYSPNKVFIEKYQRIFLNYQEEQEIKTKSKTKTKSTKKSNSRYNSRHKTKTKSQSKSKI
jgi:predicted Zn-dependent peptidase